MLLPTAVLTGLYVLLAVAAAAVSVVASVRAAHRARRAPAPPGSLPFVSVLVAARDEADHLPACLDALLRQDYPAGRYECVVANDGSVDATAPTAARYAAEDPRVRLVDVPQGDGPLHGKARALHAAVQAARGNLLLVTDADCTPPAGWVRHLAARLAAPGAGVVCGVTVVRHATLLDRIQALDWTLLLTVAAAASGAGVPVTAMGNNMAFRREAYDAVGGYPALPFSVTEDYALFRAIHRTRAWHVRLLLDPAVVNVTTPLPTLRAVFRQRRRWARGGLRAGPGVHLLYGVVYGCHLSLAAGLVLQPAVAAPLLAAKLLADLLVVRAGMARTGQRGLLRSFLPFEGYLFAYLLAMPLSLLLQPRTRWKGRVF